MKWNFAIKQKKALDNGIENLLLLSITQAVKEKPMN